MDRRSQGALKGMVGDVSAVSIQHQVVVSAHSVGASPIAC